MTVTDQQARALVFLAAACRPNGAPRWDDAGIHAAIGKVSHLSLPEVALATIRAARDRDAKTPGVIAATTSIHWAERITSPPVERDGLHTHELCSVCLKPEADCRRLYATDHEFQRNSNREGRDVSGQVDALKALVEATKPRPAPKAAPEPEDRPEHVRAAYAAVEPATDPTPTTHDDSSDEPEEAA